jgi:hypothetical protein
MTSMDLDCDLCRHHDEAASLRQKAGWADTPFMRGSGWQTA